MIKIGNLEINESDYAVAVVFFLKKESNLSYCADMIIDSLTWTVKIIKGNHAVCAKTDGFKKSKKSYFESAYKAIQRFLDIVCLIKKPAMSIDYDTKQQVSFYICNNPQNRSLEIISRDYLKFEADIQIEARDSNGNIINPKITATYVPAARYLRMSQLSESLLDAYRYLFLSVESALNAYSPHNNNNNNKREREWFGDVLELANKTSKNPLVYTNGIKKHFMNYHYTKMRNKLFHSKGKMILPFDNYDMSMLYDAYIGLFDICAMIFEVQFNQNIKGGFLISEYAIKALVEAIKIDNINFFEKNTLSHMDVLKIKNIDQLTAKGYSGHLKVRLKVIDQCKTLFFDKYELSNLGISQINYEFKELVSIKEVDTLVVNHSVFYTNQNIIDRPFMW